jgi:hypothetical protein
MNEDGGDPIDPWLDFLDPDKLRPRLIEAAVFLAGFEVLRESIVGRLRSFYMNGFDFSGITVDPKYETEVRSRNRSDVYASLDWLRENGVVGEADLQTFEELKRTRNRIAHELSDIAYKGNLSNGSKQLPVLIELVSKIENWWIINVDIATNPDIDPAEIDEEGIQSGTVLSLRVMQQIALGPLDEAREFLKSFTETRGRRRH